MSYIFWC